MKGTSTWAFVAALVSLCASCGGRGGDRQEEITGLRTFGLSATPVVSTPSDIGAAPNTVVVTIYAAVPLGQTASIEPFEDSAKGSAFAIPAEGIIVQAGSEQYEAHNTFQLFSANAAIAIPTLAQLHRMPGAYVGSRLRYGVTITSGSAHEDVVADLIILPKDSPEIAWINPTVDIVTPAESATVSTSRDNTLQATVGNSNSETLKVGWFISDGMVTNRRAAKTVWKLDNTGPQTVAVTVHGLRSRGFAIKVIDVTGN